MAIATKYTGTFTVRMPNGQDKSATVAISYEGATSPEQVGFSAEPAVLTWGDCDIYGGFHAAQLELNLLAKTDGAFRDLYIDGAVYCTLSIQGKTMFKGRLASRTIEEPFSREKNYIVSLTFSDFGLLNRVLVPDSFKNSRFKIRDLFTSALANVAVSPSLSSVYMTSAKVGTTGFLDLYVGTDQMFDSDGVGRSWKSVLQEILLPAGVHCMQWNGSFLFFTLDDIKTHITFGDTPELFARSTGAMLTSTERFKKIILTYDQGEHSDLAESKVSADDVSYKQGWISLPFWSGEDDALSDSCYVFLCGEVEEDKCGYYCIVCKGGDSTKAIALNANIGTYNNRTLPVNWSYSSARPFAHLEPMAINVNGYFDTAGNLPTNLNAIKVNVNLFAIKKSQTSAGANPNMFFRIRFYNTSEGKWYRYCYVKDPYNTGEADYVLGWWSEETYQESQYQIRDVQKLTSEVTSHYSSSSVNVILGVPSSAGRIVAYAYMTTESTSFNGDFYVFVTGQSIERVGYDFDEAIEIENKRKVVTGLADGEEYNATYKYGTPTIMTSHTNSDYRTGSSSAPVASNPFIERMKNLIVEQNTGRMVVKGLYCYDHIDSDYLVPCFNDYSHALRSLSVEYWYLRSEQWSLRTGKSDLIIEEIV